MYSQLIILFPRLLSSNWKYLPSRELVELSSLGKTVLKKPVLYHMACTPPRTLSMQTYWENARMRAVRISASRAGKSRTALLGTGTGPCDAILGDFVSFKHPSNLQPEKQMQTTY